MSAAPLAAIEQWLSALAPRVRALRVAHGASRLVAAALGTASAVLLLDAGFALPPWARGLFLSVWVTAVGVMAWRWVLVPWRGELPLAEVADEVGKRLPELGERLRAAVGAAPPGHSAEDTARELGAVDGALAVPVGSVAGLATGALIAVAAAAAAAAFVPGTGDRLRRVAAPWVRPGAAHAFRVVVTSGEPVVRRGGPVTLSAYAERTAPAAAEPPEAVLVTRDGSDAPEVRTPMSGDGAAFHAARPYVHADFEYRVEIGAARSEWFRVTVLDAVELAPGTAVEIAPPRYATAVPKRTLTALADFDGLEHGTVTLRLRFTQPAAGGHLEWRPAGGPKPDTIPLEFAPDRYGATTTLTLTGSGVLRLVLVREANGKRLRTDTTANVHVNTDEPPRFVQLSGVTARPRTARAGSRVPVAFVARDDLGVAGAELQYVVGDDESKPASVPVPLGEPGTPRTFGLLDFDLIGKARPGDTVRFRVVVTDNRNVGALGPQAAVFPRDGWSELKITATAPPLAEQDVACVRDAFREGLIAASKELSGAADEAAAIDAATAGQAALPFDQGSRLNNLGARVRVALGALRDAARDAALTPELRALATAARAVADQKARAAEDALRRAETDAPAVRAEAFAAAVAGLRATAAKLNELDADNARLARARLDRLKLAALANDQAALAGAAATDPEARARQRELVARLTALLAESEPLRAAYDGARGEEVRRLAAALAELSAHLRELDAAAKQISAEARAALVSAITRDQDAVTKRAAALFARLDTAARLAGTALPRADDFPRVAELAAAGKTVDALAEVERHALALDRLATAFERLTAERADPKAAAKQLAQWEDDLLARFRAANKAGGFAALPDGAKAALRAEQKALAAAVEALALPPDEPVRAARAGAALHTGVARDALAGDGALAETALASAVKALNQLADRTRPVGERLTASLRVLEKLQTDWDASGKAVDAALRAFDRRPPDAVACATLAKQFAPSADKQRKLIEAAAALDLPGLGERHARIVAAMKTAASDLDCGAPFDVQASQQWVRREFERLKLVLENGAPPDAKVEELHRKLDAAAAALEAHGPNLTAALAEVAQPAVQHANGQLERLSAVEAPALLNDARVAVQSAEAAFREGKPDETRRRVRAAAAALGRLSERLHGSESDRDRLKRLAALRRAERPKDLLTSDEASRQLGREVDELTHTRVGVGGQALKRRALDLYAKLRAKTDADRVGTDLKTLTAVLDELAAKTADIAELTAGVSRPAPAPPSAADEFYPSKVLADALRDLEKGQRAIQPQVTNLAAELAGRLRPAAVNPFAALETAQRAIVRDAAALAKGLGADVATRAVASATLAADRIRVAQVPLAQEEAKHAANFFRQLVTAGDAKPWGQRAADLVARQDAVSVELAALLDRPDAAAAQQVARAGELVRTAGEFSMRLTLAAESFAADDPTGKALAAAGAAVKETEKRLAEAAAKAVDGSAAEAEKLRANGLDSLRAAADAIAAVPIPPADDAVEPGEALRVAERAMRKAVAELAPGGSTTLAQKAATDAVRALTDAGK